MKKKAGPILGYDIGGTKVAVCVADTHGSILAHQRLPSGGASAYAEILPEMVGAGKRLLKEAGFRVSDVLACGVCAPGPLDIANGLMLKSPNLCWDQAPVRDDLQQQFGVPTFLDNDANAGVLAEWFFGAAKGRRDVVYLTMSTGVGGGVVCGGQLLTGTTGVGAELGHMVLDLNGPFCGCGMRGCLEAYCGGRSVARQLRELLRDSPDHEIMHLPEVSGNPANLGYPALRAAVRRGIPVAVELWDQICLRLAQGIGVLLMTFNPEIVVLGTVAYYSGDLLLDPVRRMLPRFAWRDMRDPCRIEVAALGDKIGEMAGVSVGLYYGLGRKG